MTTREATPPLLPDEDGGLFVGNHLAELRTRLLRCLAYVAVATLMAWCCYAWIFALISYPILPCLDPQTGTFLVTGIAEGFLIKFKVSVVAGVIVAIPGVLLEAWGFIAPGLHPHEQRFVRSLLPLSAVLFLAGVLSAYLILPVGVSWLFSQNPAGVTLLPSLSETVSFVLGMLLACGLLFQFPVVIMGLAKLGIVTGRMLRTRWREAVMITLIAAAIITPSADALTMCVLAVPLLGLYALSLLLVNIVERRRGAVR